MTGRVRPFTLVIAAPSGAGKTSLARALVEKWADVVFSLSATTRPPRPGELAGIDYEFVDDAGFERLLADDELLEWAMVHGRRYGTLRRGVQDALADGRTVVLDIDIQGARKVRAVLPEAVLVFILPPSVAEMERRLCGRASGEDSVQLATRLRTARAELEAVKEFDYVVVNDDFDLALTKIEAIITAERTCVARLPELGDKLEEMRRDIDVTLERSY
ncbi:guanylate kinase [soil metagenome]